MTTLYLFLVNCEDPAHDANITVTYAVAHSKCWDIENAATEAKAVSIEHEDMYSIINFIILVHIFKYTIYNFINEKNENIQM